MKIAALYDIHGNLPALEAVLAEALQSDIDQLLIGGDVVLGPMSKECLDLLMNLPLPIQYIKGNCEEAVLSEMKGQAPTQLPDHVVEDLRWTAQQLSSSHREFMTSWPNTLTLEMEKLGKVLFCHGTPRDLNENFTRNSSKEKLKHIFSAVEADMVICGHTHMQFDFMLDKIRIINAGSVGMPFGSPGAYWLLLDSEVSLCCTSYDLQAAVQKVEHTSYPHARSFAEHSILHPPSEDVMIEALKG